MRKQERKVLVAYDGSAWAEEALADLRYAGLGQDCELLVMSVADVIIPPPISIEDAFPKVMPEAVKLAQARSQQVLNETERLAERGAERIRALFPAWKVWSKAEADSPAWAIIRESEEWKPDLIVMGARGLSGFGGRLILGSVSQRVLYEAACSVRIGRDHLADIKRPIRILIGVDNSGGSNEAVSEVCSRSWPDGTEVALLTVVDTVIAIPSRSSDSPEPKWIDVSSEESWPLVREIFEPVAQRLRDSGLHTEILIRRGNPSDEILQEAHTWGADCVFVGAKGTRGIDRLLLGSVSASVSARAPCSVEVVRPMS